MGLFSFLSGPGLEPTSKKIAGVALSIDVSPSERAVADTMGIEVSRLVSERVQLMVGISEATVAYAHRESKRKVFDQLLVVLQALYRDHFAKRPGLDAALGERVYRRARDRYIMRMPAELAVLFEQQLRDPGTWDAPPDLAGNLGTPSKEVASLVKGYSERIGRFTFDCAMSLSRK